MENLGNYESQSPDIVNRHIDMLTGFGGNVFLSYLTDDNSDLQTSRMFESPIAEDASIGLTYHVSWRLLHEESGKVNLGDPAIRNKFESDLEDLAQRYFMRNNYFRLKGMPVLYLYDCGVFSGDVQSSLRQIREAIRRQTGFDIFLVGDTMKWKSPESSRIKPYDAVTKWSTYYKDDGDAGWSGPLCLRTFFQVLNLWFR